MVEIRKFKLSDSPTVSRLIRKAIEESKDYPPGIQNSLADQFGSMKVALMGMSHHCLVVEDDGNIVGTAAIEGATVCNFFVHPRYRNSLVGALLLNAIEAKAYQLKITRLTVGASPTVIPIFEREGYQRTGKRVEASDGQRTELMKRLA